MPPTGREQHAVSACLFACQCDSSWLNMQMFLSNDQYHFLTLSIDGTVITKMASVGGDVELQAMTRGHTSGLSIVSEHSSIQRRTH